MPNALSWPPKFYEIFSTKKNLNHFFEKLIKWSLTKSITLMTRSRTCLGGVPHSYASPHYLNYALCNRDKAHEFVVKVILNKRWLIYSHHLWFRTLFHLPELDSPNPLLKIVTHDGTFQNFTQIKEVYKQERPGKMLNGFIDFLRSRNLVPALFFIFSRKECEKMAKSLHKSLTTAEEQAEIDNIFNYELRNHKKTYERSPQYHQIHALLLKGEHIIIQASFLFSKKWLRFFWKGLIKILFATETFARCQYANQNCNLPQALQILK